MKKYTINYSFIGPTGLTISGEMTVDAGDNSEARNTAQKALRNKYAWPVERKNVWWNKPKPCIDLRK